MATALAELALLNTSIPFQSLHRSLYPITRSLPLILHYKQTIANLLVSALTNPNSADVALCAPHVIDLIPSYIQCLSPDPDFKQLHLETILSPIMRAIVGLAIDPPSLHIKTGGDRGNDPNSPVEISKRAFQVLAWTFRQLGSDLVNGDYHQKRGSIAWSWVVDGLSGRTPHIEMPLEIEGDKTAESADQADVDLQDEDDIVGTPAEAGNAKDSLIVAEVPATDSLQPASADTEENEELGVISEDSESAGEDDGDDEAGVFASKSARRRPLSATKPHLRRLLATCFAFLLRRAKNGDPLQSLVGTILESLRENSTSELHESTAWIILESVKSVETHIHSRGPAILRAFIRQASSLQIESSIEILDAALTGILHHARLETVGPITEVVLARLNQARHNTNTSFDTTLTLHLVSVLSGTRRGARLSDKEKTAILQDCERLTVHETDVAVQALHVQTLATALLNAPNLETMLDSGRKVLERVWSTSQVSIAITVFL